MRSMMFRIVGAWLMTTALLRSAPALADDDRYDGSERDHDRVHRAVERGDILPLETILRTIRPSIKGEIVGIEIEKEDDRWIYEFKVIDRHGRLVEVYADAKTARVVKIEDD